MTLTEVLLGVGGMEYGITYLGQRPSAGTSKVIQC